MKIAHIFACKGGAVSNCGDYILGIATKKYFVEQILNLGQEQQKQIKFKNFDCRDEKIYNKSNINKLNEYDYILVGGGGLILPDSAPNKNSCWQWNINKDCYQYIKKPIYVISIGYNLFFNQNISMPNRKNNKSEPIRINIFKDNITELLNKSEHFSLRHNNDIVNLLKIIGEQYREKVKYEECPTIWYVKNYWTPKLNKNNSKFVAIEVKDDRPNRRYYKINRKQFYNILKSFVIYCKNHNISVCYLSHDGSNSFYKFLKSNKINIPYIDNSCSNEDKIINNFSKIKTILCMAGHSQMISYGLNIKTISLVSHPKLLNFCLDNNINEYVNINEDENILNKIKFFL